MAFIKESFLRKKASDRELQRFSEQCIVKSASLASITVFLSHSHKDKEIAQGFKNLLAQCGIKVYIDWEDSELREAPNKETAERIKEKIKKLDLFILLATKNSLSSRWCPWEIGIADGYKGYDMILIVPISDDYGNFIGNEYLKLYKRVEIVKPEKLFILEPEVREYGTILYESEIGYQGKLLCNFLKRILLKEI